MTSTMQLKANVMQQHHEQLHGAGDPCLQTCSFSQQAQHGLRRVLSLNGPASSVGRSQLELRKT